MDIVSGRRLKEFYDNLIKYFPKKTALEKVKNKTIPLLPVQVEETFGNYIQDAIYIDGRIIYTTGPNVNEIDSNGFSHSFTITNSDNIIQAKLTSYLDGNTRKWAGMFYNGTDLFFKTEDSSVKTITKISDQGCYGMRLQNGICFDPSDESFYFIIENGEGRPWLSSYFLEDSDSMITHYGLPGDLEPFYFTERLNNQTNIWYRALENYDETTGLKRILEGNNDLEDSSKIFVNENAVARDVSCNYFIETEDGLNFDIYDLTTRTKETYTYEGSLNINPAQISHLVIKKKTNLNELQFYLGVGNGRLIKYIANLNTKELTVGYDFSNSAYKKIKSISCDPNKNTENVLVCYDTMAQQLQLFTDNVAGTITNAIKDDLYKEAEHEKKLATYDTSIYGLQSTTNSQGNRIKELETRVYKDNGFGESDKQLDTYITPGFYSFSYSDFVPQGNYPLIREANEEISIFNFSSTYGNESQSHPKDLTQIIFYTRRSVMYVRYYNGSEWSEWEKITTTKDLQALQDIIPTKYFVEQLPSVTEADKSGIYFVKKTSAGNQDEYDEYVWAQADEQNSNWEKIGSTGQVDLSSYALKTELDKKADRQTSGGGFEAGGGDTYAGGGTNIGIGYNVNTNSVEGSSIAIGKSANITGHNPIGIGTDVQAIGAKEPIVIGHAAKAGQDYNIAIGSSAHAYGINNVVIGHNAIDVKASNSVIIGHNTQNNLMNEEMEDVVVIGPEANCSGNYGIVIGSEAYASTHDIIIGSFVVTEASTNGAIAIGNNTETAKACIGIGQHAVASAEDSIAIGRLANIDPTYAIQSIAIGGNAKAYEAKNIVIGATSQAKGTGDIVIGTGSDSNPNSEDGVSTETNAIIIGNNSKGYSHDDNIIIGSNASAEINSVIIGNTASGTSNASIGIGNSVSAGEQATVIGTEASGEGSGSIAIGFQSSAGSTGSIAIGNSSQSQTDSSIVIGQGASVSSFGSAGCVVLGTNASSMGGSVIIGYGAQEMTGSPAIAIGANAYVDAGIAIGDSSNAGNGCTVVGMSASATEDGVTIGYGAKAKASKQTVIGSSAEITSSTQKAVQLGRGTLSDTGTLFQVVDYPMLDTTGKIPEERLPQTKASIPFGKGTLTSSSAGEIKVTIDGVTELKDRDLFLIEFPSSGMKVGESYNLNINNLGSYSIWADCIDSVGSLDYSLNSCMSLLQYSAEREAFIPCSSLPVFYSNSAKRLDNYSYGSINQPVYFDLGIPKECTGTLLTLSDDLTYEAVS